MSSMMLFCDGQSWFSYDVDLLRRRYGMGELWCKKLLYFANCVSAADAPSHINRIHQSSNEHIIFFICAAYGFALSFDSVSRSTHRWRRRFIFANLPSVHCLTVKCDTFSTVSVQRYHHLPTISNLPCSYSAALTLTHHFHRQSPFICSPKSVYLFECFYHCSILETLASSVKALSTLLFLHV